MTVTLTRLDPTGADRTALIDFLVSNTWPFHSATHRSHDEAAAVIDSGGYRDDGNDTYWVDDDEVGRIGFIRFEDLTSSPLFDLRLGESARGHGYGVEALRAGTRHVFTTMPQVHRFEGTTRADNVAMRRTFQAGGWVKEAHYRQGWPSEEGPALDAVGYAILRSDWESGTTTPVPWDDLP